MVAALASPPAVFAQAGYTVRVRALEGRVPVGTPDTLLVRVTPAHAQYVTLGRPALYGSQAALASGQTTDAGAMLTFTVAQAGTYRLLIPVYVDQRLVALSPAVTFYGPTVSLAPLTPASLARAVDAGDVLQRLDTPVAVGIILPPLNGDLAQVRTDLWHYRDHYRLPQTPLHAQFGKVSGFDALDTSATQVEAELDVEALRATAPGADITIYAANDRTTCPIHEPLKHIVREDRVRVVSISMEQYGSSQACRLALSGLFREGAREGITFLAASGDLGSLQTAVNLGTAFPASDPDVTAVGGANFAPWPDTLVVSYWGSEVQGGGAGGGGGYDRQYVQPRWQRGLVAQGDGRGVPDVAFLASGDFPGMRFSS